MTSEKLALRRAFVETLVRAGDAVEFEKVAGGVGSYVSTTVFVHAAVPSPHPPLPNEKQLALSVLLGEEGVSAFVLMSALEDAGVLGAGAIAAAEDGPLDFGAPEYHDGESYRDGDDRYRELARGWCRGKRGEVYGLCRGVLGAGHGTVGTVFGRFLDRWLGRKSVGYNESQWPTSAYLSARIAAFPRMARVFRHLRDGATPTMTPVFDRLIAHLEQR